MSVFSKSFPTSFGSRVFQVEEDGKFNVYEMDPQRASIVLSLRGSSVEAAILYHEQYTAALKELRDAMPHLCPKEPASSAALTRKIVMQ